MATAVVLSSLCLEGDMSINWKRYLREFEAYIDAYHEAATEKKKVSILLHHAGVEAREIYDAFVFDKETDKWNLEEVTRRFNEHFVPTTNITYERFMFLTRKQNENESFEQFMTALKTASKNCNFGTLKESLIKDVFICGINDSRLQQTLLRKPELDMTGALDYCRTRRVVSIQVESIKKEEIDTSKVKEEPLVDMVKRKNIFRGGKRGVNDVVENCQYCGYKHQYGKCPAFGQKCNICNKNNHFSRKCRNKDKPVNIIEESDEEYTVNSLQTVNNKGKWYTVKVEVSGSQLTLKVDTGAQCNVIGLQQFLDLNLELTLLKHSNISITSFSNNKIEVFGCLTLKCSYKSKVYLLPFMVVNRECSNILGLKSAEQLGLIKRVDCIGINLQENIKAVVPKDYWELFDGKVGCISQEINIEVDETVTPVISPARRIPYALEAKVKQELDRMVAIGIIEPVEEPTDWVSQMVVVQKKDRSLRICLDPRSLNKATKRAHYPLPKLEDIASNLAGAKHFCKLDAQSGFWMLPLNKKTSRLCTFQTKWGRYSFLRLPFGINAAPEIFHRIINETFREVKNVETYQDDIFIWGDTESQLQDTLVRVLKIAKDKGIKFNPNKFIFDVKEITFLGHRFGREGMSIDTEKNRAIMEMKIPTDKKSLQRILGVFNYLCKFIPNYSEKSAVLRDLLKKDSDFVWEKHHEDALRQLQKDIANAPVLGFYDQHEEVLLSVDASPLGLGATLIQKGRPLAYASKALTETQSKYSQIEREMLAVCFGVEKFKQYLFGTEVVKVQTDHKPLLGIVKKPLHKIPARLQRMMLRLQPYRLHLIYTPGKFMYIADALSRDFTEKSSDTETKFDEVDLQVNMLIENLPVTVDNWNLLTEHTGKDPVLQTLKLYILHGWPTYNKTADDVKPFYHDKEELSCLKGLIFKGNRIVVPKTLKQVMLEKLHTGHPGISRMTSRAELTLFWNGINQDIKKYVKSCLTCKKFQSNKIKLVMKSKETPQLPWSELGCDVCEFENKYYLIVVDALSNFIEVSHLANLRSMTVVEKLKEMFSRHGIPLILYTDGALYFDSELFKKFTKDWGFNHIMSSPHYPKSNGLAESAVKTIKTLFKKCVDAKEDPYLALLNQRATPKGVIHSPAAMLMGRNLRTNIPCNYKTLEPNITLHSDRKLIEKHKQRTEEIYNQNARKRTEFNQGQSVVFKKMPKSAWEPGKILKKTEHPRSFDVINDKGGIYRRNEIHISPVLEPEISQSDATMNNSQVQTDPSEQLTDKLVPVSNHSPLASPKATSTTATDKSISRVGRIIQKPKNLLDYYCD